MVPGVKGVKVEAEHPMSQSNGLLNLDCNIFSTQISFY